MRIPSGVTDQYIYFVAVDATDFATRETGLSSFTVYRSRNGGAAAAMTTPTINEVDSTNMPGVYELLLDEDMTIGTGNDSEEMVFHITHAGMAPVTRTIELYRPKLTAGETLTVSSGDANSAVQSIATDAIDADALAADAIAEINATVDTALADIHLDHLMAVAAADVVVDGSVIAHMVSATEDWSTFVPSTDSLEAVRNHIGDGSNLTEAGGTGDQLTAVPYNSAWDAEIQSEVTDALNAYDPPTRAELTTDTNSVLTRLGTPADTDVSTDILNLTPGGDGTGVDVQMIDGNAAAAGRLRQWITEWASGTVQADDAGGNVTLDAGGSAVDDFYNGDLLIIFAGTGAGQSRTITDYTGSSKVAVVDSPFATTLSTDSDYLILPQGLAIYDDVQAIIADLDNATDGLGALKTLIDAIQTEVEKLTTTAHSEPTGVPAANEAPIDKLGYLFMALRNQVDVTATKKTFYDDSGAAEWEKDLSDDGTTYSESEGNAI